MLEFQRPGFSLVTGGTQCKTTITNQANLAMAGRGCSMHEDDFELITASNRDDADLGDRGGGPRGIASRLGGDDLSREEKRALGSWSGPSAKGASGERATCCRCKEQPATVRAYAMHGCPSGSVFILPGGIACTGLCPEVLKQPITHDELLTSSMRCVCEAFLSPSSFHAGGGENE